MNAQYALFTKAKIEGFLVLLRGVAGFSNLRGLIVIECLFLFLSSFLKPEKPGAEGGGAA